MKEVIIKFQPFVLQQTVFVKDDAGVTELQMPQKDITKFLSLEENVSAVHLFGNEKLVERIKEDCVSKYKLDKIKYYINC